MRRVIAVSSLALWISAASAQEAPAKSPLFEEISEILVQLSKITGWKAPPKVESDTITKEALKGFLEDRLKEIVKPEEIRAEELSLKKLGLVPADFDLKKVTVDLLTEQAAAFYDYRKKKLFVLDTNATITQKPVLVHELAHALADVHVNLEKYILKGKSDDSALARQAVMEGQATWLMSEYLMVKMGTSLRSAPEMADAMNRATGSSSGMFPVFDSSPLYLRESLLFPYTKGFLFQQAVVVKHGLSAFSEVFRNPPLSSQQIIHPEKYFSKVQPAKPPLPKADLKGYAEIADGTLGEFDHDVLFRQYGTEADRKRAEKWRGGHFRVWEHKKDKNAVLLYVSEWEDAASAREAFRLYKLVLKGKWKIMEIQSESETEVDGRETTDSSGYVWMARGCPAWKACPMADEMFTVRTIFLEQQRQEAANYDLVPTNEQGKSVCALFLSFLASQPPEFRQKLPFLKHGETELEWAAAEGCTAFASFFESGEPLSMGVLLSGINEEADRQMIGALRQSILEPAFGEGAGEYVEAPERPLMLNVVFPGNPELIPRTQLLSTALASVYFRVMHELHDASTQAPQ